MFRRSLLQLRAASQKSNVGRTVVRDPRKTRVKKDTAKAISVVNQEAHDLTHNQQNMHMQPSHSQQNPFQAMAQDKEQTVGSAFATYALLGAGVTLGVTFVRLIIG